MAVIGLRSALGFDVHPASANNKFRAERFKLFRALVDDVLLTKNTCRILDVGGTADYWSKFGAGLPEGVKITIVDKYDRFGEEGSNVEFEVGDACDLSQHADNSFDIVHSNSTIEHVGLWGQMQQMASEVRRLAPRYFVQTPNYWFPIEPHARTPLIHYLPEPLRASLVLRKTRGWWGPAADLGEAMSWVHSAILLDARQMAFLFPDASIKREKFYGLTKSLMAIKR